jgi:hypothetical protein
LTTTAKTDLSVDQQFTLAERKSHTSSNSRPYTNASKRPSKRAWGASFGTLRTGGRWSHWEAKDHINILELKAAFFALTSFVKDMTDRVICLKLDNSRAVAYLNNLGGTHSSQLFQLTLAIWEWCEKKRIFLIAQHIPGITNTAADIESRTTRDWNDRKLKTSVIHPLITDFQVDQISIIHPLITDFQVHQLDRYVIWRPDPQALHMHRCLHNELVQHQSVRLPSIQPISCSPPQNESRDGNSDVSSSHVVSPTLVAPINPACISTIVK